MFWLTVALGEASTASATLRSDFDSESSWVRMESSSTVSRSLVFRQRFFAPLQAVAADQRRRCRRSPGARGIGHGRSVVLVPVVEDRLDPFPGGFQLVAAHEQGQ